jgi:hypothetical protein
MPTRLPQRVATRESKPWGADTVRRADAYNLSVAAPLGGVPLAGVPRWRGGRAVECTGLENRQGLTAFASSNLALSAKLGSEIDNPALRLQLDHLV